MGNSGIFFLADERHCSATELEALALVEAVKHFGYYLYDRQFIAFTDHKPLCSLLVSHRLNRRLRRMGIKLKHWMIDIQYLPGEDNGLAKALSREERRKETGFKDGIQSSIWGCEGAPSTKEEIKNLKRENSEQ